MKIEPLLASTFRSDGGNQFGLVPKALWARRLPPDADNCVPQHAHSLLVTLDDGRTGLVDTGCGAPSRFSATQRRIAGLGGEDAPWPLLDSLRARGLDPVDIDFVVLTHLHWDHVGGVFAPGGGLTFPNAVHHVDLHELEDATGGSPLLGAAYSDIDLRPLVDSGSLRRHLHDERNGPASVLFPGVRLVRTGGHTRAHCLALFEAEEGGTLDIGFGEGGFRRAVFPADVCPSQHHLPHMYGLSYDTHPLDTRGWKLRWLPRFAAPDTMVFFCHDPDLWGAVLRPGAKRTEVDQAWECAA